jgi:hypothetical protein
VQYAAAGEEKNGQIEGTSREYSDEQGRIGAGVVDAGE